MRAAQRKLHALINALQFQESSLASAEEELSSALEKVRGAREKTRVQLAWHKNCAAQLSILPAEILSYSFELATCEDARSALLMSSVCRQWRAVALQTPCLWTSIVSHDKRASIQLLQLYLDRSAACLLDVELHLSESIWWSKLARPLSKMLRPHVPRFRRLSVFDEQTCTKSYAIKVIQPLLCANARHLECLRIDHGVGRLSGQRQGQSPLLSAQLPALKHLEIGGEIHDLSFDIRVATLTHIDVSFGVSVDYPSLRAMLGEARSLQQLSLTSYAVCRWHGFPPPICLPDLQCFTYSIWDRSSARLQQSLGTAIRVIDAPSLTVLRIDGQCVLELFSMATVSMDLLASKFRQLQELHMSDVVSYADGDLDHSLSIFIQTLPSISAVSLLDSDEDSWTIQCTFGDSASRSAWRWASFRLLSIHTPSNEALMVVMRALAAYHKHTKLVLCSSIFDRICFFAPEWIVTVDLENELDVDIRD